MIDDYYDAYDDDKDTVDGDGNDPYIIKHVKLEVQNTQYTISKRRFL